MTIIDRARYLLFGDIPHQRKARASTAVADPLTRIILTNLGKQAVWSKQDFLTLSREGYEKCMAVYACVSKIASAAAGLEFVLKQGDKAVGDHPLLRLLWRPNAAEGQRQWLRRRFSQLLLHGNSYTQAVRPIKSQPPAALYLPRPDRIRILPGGPQGAQVGGYEYSSSGSKEVIPPEFILHSKLFHPTHDFYGLSPLTVASRGIDVSNMAAEWNMRLLQNDMRPPGVLSTEGMLSDEKYEQLKESVREEYEGHDNAGKPLLLEGGLTWQQTAMSPKELDWIEGVVHNKREIASVFNVAPELIGDSQSKTYSNFQEARRALYTECVIPLMDEYVDDLNNWLCPMFGENLWLEIDRDGIEALQEDREKKFAYVGGAQFMTVNEKRAAVGLEPLTSPAGDMVLVSYSTAPLDIVAAGQTVLVQGGAAAEQGGGDGEAAKSSLPAFAGGARKSWAAADRREALWHNFVRRVETKERSLISIVRSYLTDQSARVAKTRTVNVDTEAKEFLSALRPWAYNAARQAGAAGMRAAKGELPEIEEKVDLFDLTPEARAYLDEIILRSGTQIAETTMALIRDTLAMAEFADWTTEQLTQKLIERLNTFAQWRCRQIARTESTKVENWAQVEGYKENEFVTRQGWLCSFVPDSRDDHIEADGQEVPVGGDFVIGGQAMAYPGDPRGGAGNVVNCLCSTYPIVD